MGEPDTKIDMRTLWDHEKIRDLTRDLITVDS